MKYRPANAYFKERFGRKMYKASISLRTTCPNRDGSRGTGGCTFCSAGGSGEFGADPSLSVKDQIDQAIERVSRKTDADTGFIAYFQSFTGTYCDPGYLEEKLTEAASHPRVLALSVATRPDCLPEDILQVLERTAGKIPLYVELGLQTSSDSTASVINRCYPTEEYKKAVESLHGIGAEVITHVIFGLPGESTEDMLDTVRYAVSCGTDGIKFTCLFVLKGTEMERQWREGKVKTLEMEEYFDIVEKALNILPENVIVHRMTGDGPKALLLAPLWTSNKRKVINYINRRFGQ